MIIIGVLSAAFDEENVAWELFLLLVMIYDFFCHVFLGC